MIKLTRLIVIPVVLLTVFIAGCGGNNSANANIPTVAPLTVTPTVTPKPTSTPIPEELGDLPGSVSEASVAILNRQAIFEITRAERLQSVGSNTPGRDKQYIALHGFVYNYDTEPLILHDTDFRISYTSASGNSNDVPSVTLMEAYKETISPELEHPFRDRMFAPDFVISAKSAKPTTLIYEVDRDLELFELAFISFDTRITVLLIEGQGGDYLAYKVGEGDQLDFQIEFDSFIGRTSEVLDVEEIEVDNCFGSAEISRTRTFSRETLSLLVVENDSRLVVSPLAIAFLADLVRAEIGERHTNIEGSRLTETRTENLSASPRTRPRWEMIWYLEALEGTAIIKLGEDVYRLPYRLGDRLRADLRSLPAEPCT